MTRYLHDLTEYSLGKPPSLIDNGDANQVTFPDLHGNALAALYRLEAHGVLKLTESQRIAFAEIYLESTHLTTTHYEDFVRLLGEVEVDANKFECVRFIGDVLGDRGRNDILTLLVLKKLKDANVKTTVIFSNHDLELIKWSLSNKNLDLDTGSSQILKRPMLLNPAQYRSLIGLITYYASLTKENKNDIHQLIDSVYNPMVKIFDYSINRETTPPTVRFYSHAPVGMEAIEYLTTLYNIPYDDSTPEKLCEMIDKINTKFSDELMQDPPEKLGKELAKQQDLRRQHPSSSPENFSLIYPAWNKASNYFKDLSHQNYKIINIHGHMGDGLSPWNKLGSFIQGENLDNENIFGYSDQSHINDTVQKYGQSSNDLNSYLCKDQLTYLLREHKEEKSEVKQTVATTFHFFNPIDPKLEETKKTLLARYFQNPDYQAQVTAIISTLNLEQAENLAFNYPFVKSKLMDFYAATTIALSPAEKSIVNNFMPSDPDADAAKTARAALFAKNELIVERSKKRQP